MAEIKTLNSPSILQQAEEITAKASLSQVEKPNPLRSVHYIIKLREGGHAGGDYETGARLIRNLLEAGMSIEYAIHAAQEIGAEVIENQNFGFIREIQFPSVGGMETVDNGDAVIAFQRKDPKILPSRQLTAATLEGNELVPFAMELVEQGETVEKLEEIYGVLLMKVKVTQISQTAQSVNQAIAKDQLLQMTQLNQNPPAGFQPPKQDNDSQVVNNHYLNSPIRLEDVKKAA